MTEWQINLNKNLAKFLMKRVKKIIKNMTKNSKKASEEKDQKVDNATQNQSEESAKTQETQSTEKETEVSEEKVEEKKEPTLEEKLSELNNSHLRLMADFDNYRKRTMREKAELIKNAGARLITDILPVMDNFERALTTMEKAEDVNAVKEGVELIYHQMQTLLTQNSVKVIETENQAFDTEYHEAITTIPAPTPELKDKIVDCTTKGYMMNEKVIRHAKVVVGQ